MRLALLAFTLSACGGGTRTSGEAPSARAPDVAAIAPGCSDATLRAFDPGLPGRDVMSVAETPRIEPPLAREHARPCEVAEDDDACEARARRDVLAADPDATVGAVAIHGEPDGWQAELEVDGQRRELILPEGSDVVVEVRRLQQLGHRVVPVAGRRVYRADGRRAVVSYAVPVPTAPERKQWEAILRWPVPADVPAAMERLQRETERAQLVLLKAEITRDAMRAVVACP